MRKTHRQKSHKRFSRKLPKHKRTRKHRMLGGFLDMAQQKAHELLKKVASAVEPAKSSKPSLPDHLKHYSTVGKTRTSGQRHIPPPTPAADEVGLKAKTATKKDTTTSVKKKPWHTAIPHKGMHGGKKTRRRN